MSRPECKVWSVNRAKQRCADGSKPVVRLGREFRPARGGCRSRSSDRGNFRVERYVRRVKARRLAVQVETQFHPGAEDQAMRRSTEVEHAELVALSHVLPLVDPDVAA